MVAPTVIRVGTSEPESGLHQHAHVNETHTRHGTFARPYRTLINPPEQMPIDVLVLASSVGAIAAWHLLRHRGVRFYRLPE